MSTFNDTQILPYKECKDIYRTTTLGKRIVEGLVNFAMSTQRDIDIHKAPPEAIEKFKETASEMKQDEAIKKTIYNARIYGTGALYIAMYDEEKEEDDFTTKPTFEDAYKYKIKFNVFDPLNISGSRVDLDPLSFHFLEVIDIQVNSNKIPKKRIAISHALEPLYLDTRTSLIPYSPPSVFYNMVELLKQYDDAVKSIGDLLYKAGAIIYKYPVKSKLTGVTLDAITASGNILEQKRSGEVISISNDSTVEDFPIANLNGLIDSINKLEDDITKALSDTPVSILFDRNLSNGFSEGDKDKETVISTIESFRENKLTPLYNITDYYIMLKAWDRAFIDEMRYKYSEYKDKTDNEIFRSWVDNFKFQYGNLFPEPESVIQDNNAKKLDNLLKAQQLGANPADLQEELNESEIFKNEMELNPQNMEVNEDDEEMFDYNNINSEIKADASPIPQGTEWKTLDNGEHILVNGNGTVFAGAEGALKGKYYKDKETGKFEKYTFNQQSLAAEDEKRYNESKENESSNDKRENEENTSQNNTESTINNQKEEENNKDNTEGYKKNVSKLPKDLQDIGEKLYSGKYEDAELGYYTFDMNSMEYIKNESKSSKLSELERNIVEYMKDNYANRFSQKNIDNIKQLIYNAPIVDKPLYRGVNGEKYKDKKVGDYIDFEVRSFTSANNVADDFMENVGGKNPVLFIINTPCKALDVRPYECVSEEEYFVAGKYKIDKIEEKKINGKKAKVLTISTKEE